MKQTLLIELKEAQAFLRRNVESLDIRPGKRKKNNEIYSCAVVLKDGT